MNDIVFRYLHLKGINGRKMWSTWEMMHELISQDKIDIKTVVTHRVSFNDCELGFDLAMGGDCGKVVVDF